MTLNDFCRHLHTSLDLYWDEHNLSYDDFRCRECGRFMLDTDDIKNVRYSPSSERLQYRFIDDEKGKPYVESETNRWLVKGRTLSGKVYFRHLCWDCFFKHLPEVENISKRALKSSWYRNVKNGILRPPATCASPSRYFKLLFDITDEELEREHGKFDTASLDSFIRRHGETEGRKRYEDYRKRQAYTCSKEYMMQEKGMSEDEWSRYNSSRAVTLENLVAKHGEETGRKMWDDYCRRQAYAGCKLEYFVEKYGEEEGRKRYEELNRMKRATCENFIRKYGEEEGYRRWHDFVARKEKQYSDISQRLFVNLDRKDWLSRERSRYASKSGGEVTLEVDFNGERKILWPDYIVGKRIIEFYGDFFHANPRKYKSDDIILDKTAEFVWERNRKRTEALEAAGYSVKVVWEYDFKHDRKRIVDECLKFIHEGA